MNDQYPQKANFDTWSFDEPVKSLSSWNPLSETDVCIGGHYKAEEEAADLVFVCHYHDKGKLSLTGEVKAIDDELGGALSAILKENYDSAKVGSMTPTLRVVDGTKVKKYVLVGLGKGDETKSSIGPGNRNGNALGKAIASRCVEEGSPQLLTAAVLFPLGIWSDPIFLRDVSTAFYASLYVDNRFRGTLQCIKKSKTAAKHLRRLRVDYYYRESENETAVASFDAGDNVVAVAEGRTIAEGVHLAKDIVNAPHNVLNSLSLADLARNIASESHGSLTCEILDKDDCEKRGMGAYLGVARASETPPQFIHLTYVPPKEEGTTSQNANTKNKVVGVVGKGLLFDTGGYNIKTSTMELMKFDCGGAAAVLGAAKTIGNLKPPGVECHFVVAACENMINDKGIVPSDVLVASNGVTIEVVNTDAEGRLTLADALVYCDKELRCERIIELSTLTGACMVALGRELCGIFTENDDLANELEEASKTTAEPSWRLPLVKSYESQLESKIADITNYGTRFGGSITAGLFLQHFVDTKRIPFAHIDIAGPVWDDASGATGFGAKLVTEWIRRQGR